MGILDCLLLLAGTLLTLGITLPNTVALTPQWRVVQSAVPPFTDDWVHAYTITFRKRTQEPVMLHSLRIEWDGPYIATLQASLYRTELDAPFRAIETTWVCDGVWHPHGQYLLFRFFRPQHLSSITHFHGMITVPPLLEDTLLEGTFKCSDQSLPITFHHKSNPNSSNL